MVSSRARSATVRIMPRETNACMALPISSTSSPLEDRAVDSGDFARMLLLLCGATIAIFEITENDPAIAFLLGIRCVVGPGVTILATQQKSPTAVWNTLPFNIREMSFAAYKAALFIVEHIKSILELPRRTVRRQMSPSSG
jgi:hypothetical protein